MIHSQEKDQLRGIPIPAKGTFALNYDETGAIRLTLTPASTFPRRNYVPPVGVDIEPLEIWPGKWMDATGHCEYYSYGCHTGADLNLNAPHWDADRHAPVYSIADGVVYALRTGVSGWHTVVCIRHEDCLTRYAHVENIQVREGQTVSPGQYIANIGNAGGRYPYPCILTLRG